MKTKKFSLLAGMMLGVAILFSSCKTPTNVAYVQDFDRNLMVVEAQAREAIRIQPDDKLQIIVTSKDPQLAGLFNLPVVTTRLGQNANLYGTSTNYGTTNNTSEGLSSYTVTEKGTIDFPVLGVLHVAGMTRSELASFIKGEIMGRNLIKDPTVVVEFLNNGVSVLGEVNRPGRFTFNRDELTVLDAIAMAGDLNLQGQRENVKIIRNEDGQVKIYIVDLTDGKNLYNNPGFYLKQNDLVYVEPNDMRKRATTVNANTTLSVGFWMSLFSVITSTAVLIVNLAK